MSECTDDLIIKCMLDTNIERRVDMRVDALVAVIDDPLAAVSALALGSPSLEYMEVILGHVKAVPYSLSFDGLDATSLLGRLSNSQRMIALLWIPALWSAWQTFFCLGPPS